MRKLLIFFCKYAWLVIGVLFLLSLLASTQLDKVRVELSADDLLVQDDPERDFYREVTELFGEEEIVLLYLADSDPVAPYKLAKVNEAINELQALSFVHKTESLFSVPYLKTVEGYLNKDPYFLSDGLPDEDDQAREILKQSLLNPFVKRTLVSEDLQAMAIAIVLNDDLSGISDQELVEKINTVADKLKPYYDEVFSVGYQHVRTEVGYKIKAEQGRLFPLAVGVLLICLFMLLRQVVDILLPMATAGISILWTLGLMGLFDIPLNVVTSIIPILLIIVGSTEDIHLVSEFRRGQLNGLDKLQAIEQMALRMGGIVVLTFLTTYIGFLSIGLSKIEVLWQFGLLAASGLLLNFIITISLIPAVLRLAGDWKLDGKNQFMHTPNVGFDNAKKFFSVMSRHQLLISLAVLLVTVVSIYGILSIRINHNPIDNLNEDSPVKNYFGLVNENLSGLESFSVVIDAGIQDTFLKSRYVDELKALQDFINEQQGIRSSTSFVDYLSLLNGAFEESYEAIVPESDEIIRELMIFLQYEHVSSYVTEDYSRARIVVRHNLSSTNEVRGVVEKIQSYIDNDLDKGLKARMTGDSILTLSATDSMISGQLKSITVLMVSIIIIISLLFLDWKVGLIAAIPNLFPVVVLFGVMGYMGIPLNIGTTMAAAIAIGIAVDDTMHFMLRYNDELKSRRSQKNAIYATLHSEALPVMATSIALIGGFLVFVLSDFEPIRQFGYLSALVMLTAVIADFVITPLLMAAMRLITVWDMLSLSLRKEVVEKSQLFKNMRPWQVRRFFLSSRVINYKNGDVIFQENDKSDAIFLVLRGEISIFHVAYEKSFVMEEVIEQGGVFGDITMLAGGVRTSTAVARRQSSLLLLSREGINHATNYHPLISARLFFNLAVHVSERFNRVVAEFGHKKN
jgi:predicted RND superfamily exporter protein